MSIGTLGNDEEIEREARRLVALLQLGVEEALFQGRDLGLYVEESSYSFYAYSPDSQLWDPLSSDTTFRQRDLPEGLYVSLFVEEQPVSLEPEDDPQDIVPQVAIFSSGELLPFELVIEREFADLRYVITGEADGSIELISEGEDAY